MAVAPASVRDTARVVVLGAPALTSPFRDATDRGCVMPPYTRDEWVRCLDAIGSTAQSFALAAMLLPSAPLLAAPLLGMLSPLPASP